METTHPEDDGRDDFPDEQAAGAEPEFASFLPEFYKVSTPLRPKLYEYAIRDLTVGDPAASDELVQRTYLRAYLNCHRFKPGSSCLAWMKKVMFRLFLNDYRVALRFSPDEDCDLLVPSGGDFEWGAFRPSTPEMEVLNSAGRSEVVDALNKLDIKFRVAVMMVGMEGYSHKEVADMLGIPLGTSLSRTKRGYDKLKEYLVRTKPVRASDETASAAAGCGGTGARTEMN